MSSITIWDRLEPRCRTNDLSLGLAARVHDPLWLLARQWQMGEFVGRNVGSPVTAKVQWTTAAFDRFASGSAPPQPYDGAQPIETLVERETARPAEAGGDLRQAIEAGLQFLRMLDAAKLGPLRATYVAHYPLGVTGEGETARLAAVVAGRVVDGVRLRADLAASAGQLPAAPALSATDAAAVLPLARAWAAWFDALFSEPGTPGSWSPDRMEYGFALGAAGDPNGLVAKEYDGGTVDWHTFDRSGAPLPGGGATPVTESRSLAASPVVFRGMPARRFWEMEDAAVDIGALTAAAEDLGRILLREFALIYGNDWFQVPLAVPVGSQVTIQTLQVVDSFGVVTPIPHYTAADGPAGAWRMFALREPAGATPGGANRLVIPPSAVGALDGEAVEDVLLLRDELAEMVWGVERNAIGPSGARIDRQLAWTTSQPPVPAPTATGAPRYRLGSTTPDYWIPFLPVAVNQGPLQLRRGRLPTGGGAPIGKLLGYPALTLFLEEVPREGVRLQRHYRHARGIDGSTSLWMARRRTVGRGEGQSGLAFDVLEF